jgi:hypothetical protein
MESYKPGEMNTLSQILEKLRQKGWDNEVKMSDHGKMQSADGQHIYAPEDLIIFKMYRFEGESDPSDSSVLYLLEDQDGHVGYVMDAYGMYSDHEENGFDEFIRKIPMEDRDEQVIFGSK